MYLKSIQIHGFKSFANKILFEFHDGITAIVGPNGSGKSNVADAVRWVLGEQSAKQLRGSNMQDVIFSGSEARNPLGYAFVEITFDNCDHKLPIAYDEVSVARRVYRSGESEYLINGSPCRLRDVLELFMDTGIGKEGYSIIGQGQIDRILSTKPEERRELFDEAAGIVKFKKRKSIAQNNLDEANANLERIIDIIGELENQLGPLEKQSADAKEYLRLRDILKNLEINSFIVEYEKSDAVKKSLEEKLTMATEDLENTRNANENAKSEYERLESELEDYSKALEEGRSYKSELLLAIEKKEGEIKLIEQQLLSINENFERIDERIAAVDSLISSRKDELKSFDGKRTELSEKQKTVSERLCESKERLSKLQSDMAEITEGIEESNRRLFELVNNNSVVKQSIERFDTMREQINLRKSELAQKLLTNKSLEEEASVVADEYRKTFDQLTQKLEENKQKLSEILGSIDSLGQNCHNIIEEVNRLRQLETGEKSRLETLQNIAERYEGYGNTVKKVMDMKNRFPGIIGTVADLIEVDKKYEIAVETALGASIQHIVTEDEATAKAIIEELKKEKLGRATFLPLTSVGLRSNKNDESLYTQKGVIGDAASLVRTDDRYSKVINHLLKAFIVTDKVDNALALAKANDYSLRIVTLEGEQLAPGGSIAGGAFKNTGNLLGRKREIAEITEKLAELSERIKKESDKYNEANSKRQDLKADSEALRNIIGKLSIEQNSARLNLEKESQRAEAIRADRASFARENTELEQRLNGLLKEIEKQNDVLAMNDSKHTQTSEEIDIANGKLVTMKSEEVEYSAKVNELTVEEANVLQAIEYLNDNVTRVNEEIERLTAEKKDIEDSRAGSVSDSEERKKLIDENRQAIEHDKTKIEELEKRIEDLISKRDNMTKEHKSFFDSWAELGKRVTDLEKEVMRLTNQRDKLTESLDYQISYIWDEYELTVTEALKLRDEDFKSSTSRKDIAQTRSDMKALGDVNVSAIEDYKNVSERYTLLSSQRDDLINSRESITKIIEELDEKMREQFSAQFKAIGKEFNTVFRELFGGGKGEIELVEDEDILEAGIRIIAQPPGKKLQNMMQLSGGEKALTAIALLFAIQNLKPSPFCLLDEIEAALDDSNVKRFASYLHKLTKNSQFIVITHRRGTMAAADILYGITMQEKGVSTLVSVSLIESQLDK